MELIKTHDIGSRNFVSYRQKALGIKPALKGVAGTLNKYTAEDAELMRNYNCIANHSIKHYKSLQTLINNRHRNLFRIAGELGMSEKKASDLLEEYDKSGCIIVNSKMNYER